MSKPFSASAIHLDNGGWLLQGTADPSAGAGVPAPISSVYFQGASSTAFTIWHKTGTTDTAWVPLLPQALFGVGDDGDVNIGAGTTTLARDMYYNNLTIPNTGILVPRGFRVFVRGTLTVDLGGAILMDGGDGAAAGTAGTASPAAAGSIGAAGAAGGAGGVAGGSAGGASGSAIQGYNGAGGAGGLGSGGAGGAAGAVTIQAANAQGNPRSLAQGTIATQVGGAAAARLTSGSGGGGGGGDGTAGGGGGGGGGEIHVFARYIINNGTIRAKGGNGGSPGAGNRGGGGGGGGGLILLGFHYFEGAAPSIIGGTHGNGNGTGVNGADGSVGLYVPIQC